MSQRVSNELRKNSHLFLLFFLLHIRVTSVHCSATELLAGVLCNQFISARHHLAPDTNRGEPPPQPPQSLGTTSKHVDMGIVNQITDANDFKEKTGTGAVVVDFYAEWYVCCAPVASCGD